MVVACRRTKNGASVARYSRKLGLEEDSAEKFLKCNNPVERSGELDNVTDITETTYRGRSRDRVVKFSGAARGDGGESLCHIQIRHPHHPVEVRGMRQKGVHQNQSWSAYTLKCTNSLCG